MHSAIRAEIEKELPALKDWARVAAARHSDRIAVGTVFTSRETDVVQAIDDYAAAHSLENRGAVVREALARLLGVENCATVIAAGEQTSGSCPVAVCVEWTGDAKSSRYRFANAMVDGITCGQAVQGCGADVYGGIFGTQARGMPAIQERT